MWPRDAKSSSSSWSWFKLLLLILVILLIVALVIWLCCFRNCNRKKKCNSCGQNSNKCSCKVNVCNTCNKNPCCCGNDNECESECNPQNCCKKLENLEKTVCFNKSRCGYDIQQVIQQLICAQEKTRSLLNVWSLNLAGTDEIPPPNTITNEPMLLPCVTPQGDTITSDSQTATTSVQPAPANGLIDAITIEAGSSLSAGIVSITVVVNGTPVALTGVYNTLSSSPYVTVRPSAPISFLSGDLIGFSYSSSGATWNTFPVTYTGQIWVRFT